MEHINMQKFNIKKTFEAHSALISLLVLVIAASIRYSDFSTYLNISNVFRQVSMLGLISIGMTFVILTGGIDLSVGSLFALAGVLAVIINESITKNVLVLIVVPTVICAFLGMINGFVITKLRIVPFIATLASMMGYRGIALLLTEGGASRPIHNETFAFLGRGYLLGIPVPAIILIVLTAITAFIAKYTTFGRHVYATGGNYEAARMMGISVDRIKILVYMLSGAMTGFAGVILASRLSAGQPVAGIGYEMNAVASVVIGGTLLSGGVGRIATTVVGALIIAVIGNMINLQGNVDSNWQNVITGVLLLLVIILQSQFKKSKSTQ